jgi:hypothetical protein
MEKKSVVVTPKGYTIKVSDHMLGDLAKFGVTKNKPTLKPVPKELLNLPAKELKTDVLPEMQTTADLTKVEPEVKVRKAPVRSKAKK